MDESQPRRASGFHGSGRRQEKGGGQEEWGIGPAGRDQERGVAGTTQELGAAEGIGGEIGLQGLRLRGTARQGRKGKRHGLETHKCYHPGFRKAGIARIGDGRSAH